jgi:hypothetical protein
VCVCQRPPSVLYQAIVAKVEGRQGVVEAQCLCLRPPSALPQVIAAEAERRRGGVEAQCVCQRPPSVLLGVIPFEIQFNQGRRQDSRYGLRQADGSCPLQAEVWEGRTVIKPFNLSQTLSITCPQALGNSSPSSSLAYTTASALATASSSLHPARGQHLVVLAKRKPAGPAQHCGSCLLRASRSSRQGFPRGKPCLELQRRPCGQCPQCLAPVLFFFFGFMFPTSNAGSPVLRGFARRIV